MKGRSATTPMIYGLLMLLVGACLLSGAAGLAIWFHRRYHLPYALLTVGVLTSIGALLVQIVLLRLFHTPLLITQALTIGVAAGFSEEPARLLGYQYLARSAITRPQAMMIGLGHGFTETVYTGLWAAGLGLSLLGYDAARAGQAGDLVSGALADALNGLLPIAMHLALSWIVLQVFLRGQIGWLFAAIFLHAVVEITAALLGPDDTWAVVIWRLVVAAIGLAILRGLPDSPPSPGPARS